MEGTSEELSKRDEIDYDYIFKIVMMGDSGAGKSNLRARYARNEFYLNSKPTIGVEFDIRSIKVDEIRIKAQLWDIAGIERYAPITKVYYRGASSVILVYDVTRMSTFENIKKWLKEVRDNAGPNVVLMLAANKTDMKERVVSPEDGAALAKEEGLYYVETSALDSTNVDKLFHIMFAEILHEINKKKLVEEDNAVEVVSQQGY